MSKKDKARGDRQRQRIENERKKERDIKTDKQSARIKNERKIKIYLSRFYLLRTKCLQKTLL